MKGTPTGNTCSSPSCCSDIAEVEPPANRTGGSAGRDLACVPLTQEDVHPRGCCWGKDTGDETLLVILGVRKQVCSGTAAGLVRVPAPGDMCPVRAGLCAVETGRTMTLSGGGVCRCCAFRTPSTDAADFGVQPPAERSFWTCPRLPEQRTEKEIPRRGPRRGDQGLVPTAPQQPCTL